MRLSLVKNVWRKCSFHPRVAHTRTAARAVLRTASRRAWLRGGTRTRSALIGALCARGSSLSTVRLPGTRARLHSARPCASPPPGSTQPLCSARRHAAAACTLSAGCHPRAVPARHATARRCGTARRAGHIVHVVHICAERISCPLR